MSHAIIYGTLNVYAYVHKGWVWRLILLVRPAKCVSLTSLPFSKVFLVMKRPLLIIGCLPRLLPHPLKFIKSVGLIHVHNYVTTHTNLGNQCSLHSLILYSCLVVRQVPYNAPRVLGSREL